MTTPQGPSLRGDDRPPLFLFYGEAPWRKFLEVGVNPRNQHDCWGQPGHLLKPGRLEAFPCLLLPTLPIPPVIREKNSLLVAFRIHAKGANAWLGRAQEGRGDRARSQVGPEHSGDQPGVGLYFPDCCPSRATYTILGIITYHLVYYYT